MKTAVKALIGFGVVIGLLSTGYWFGARKSESVAQISNCHPLFGDMAPNGNWFVALTPDKLEVTVSHLNSDKKPLVIKLARPASDIIAINNQSMLISYGSSGEVALLDIEGSKSEQTFKVGSFAGNMCKNAASQAYISDTSSNKIYQFDLAAKSTIQTHALKGKPSYMKWRVPDVELEIIGEQGESVGTVDVTAKKQS